MSAFPPTRWQDIDGYDFADVLEGFTEYRTGDPMPGTNRPPGYRWGWQNGINDHGPERDGFQGIRSDYIRAHKERLR